MSRQWTCGSSSNGKKEASSVLRTSARVNGLAMPPSSVCLKRRWRRGRAAGTKRPPNILTARRGGRREGQYEQWMDGVLSARRPCAGGAALACRGEVERGVRRLKGTIEEPLAKPGA